MRLDYIQQLGSIAAREGLTLWDCPYYSANAMLGHTGEAIAEWRTKVEAREAALLPEIESWSRPDGIVRYLPRSTERYRNWMHSGRAMSGRFFPIQRRADIARR